MPIPETYITGIGITNPYGRSKYMIEELLKVCQPLIIVIILLVENRIL